MFKMKMNKKLMIPVLAMVLVVAMAGVALASIYDDGFPDMWWSGQLGINSTSSWDSNETRLIQTILNDVDDAGLTIDGDYGTNTRNAVLAYQNSDVCLESDGIVGDDMPWNTWYFFQMDLYEPEWGYSSASQREYYSYWANDDQDRKYRHYEDGYWYVLVSSSWYHVN